MTAWNLKSGVEPYHSQGFLYDVLEGKFDPEKYLSCEDACTVNEAVDVLESLECAMRDEDMIEDY